VRKVVALVVLSILVSAQTVAARSDIAPIYAHALQNFNPQLSARQSLRLARCVIAEADAQGMDARLLVALIAVESSWHPRAVSSAGATGLGQLMPGTAADLGVDPDDPQANIHGAAVYLRTLINRYGSYSLALAAYNAGPGAVDQYGGIPPYAQTQRYVTAVLALWRRLAGT
jgi:soluble lytic murein transglycosylase-like protein